ncbi:hypothetical protein E2C01_073696 [Portunus trituberculatus]|uniref:Uncharacterized protein n=1 Tax=Portunus trituberculatus TaxID=210409 RepID=A0A5B7I614_PORTR|nr:hypothetical protein [Portunus trituberculatus]
MDALRLLRCGAMASFKAGFDLTTSPIVKDSSSNDLPFDSKCRGYSNHVLKGDKNGESLLSTH